MPRDDEIDHAIGHAPRGQVREQEKREQREEIDRILARSRQSRPPLPRGLWIASGIVGVICIAGFAVAMLDDSRSSHAAIVRRSPSSPPPEEVDRGAGFFAGLVVGGVAGLASGVALARQRRDHSSRRRP